ncbi:hypothetical protein J7K42_03070 [bacterium]|nr:hypothetical protein [bacterium]
MQEKREKSDLAEKSGKLKEEGYNEIMEPIKRAEELTEFSCEDEGKIPKMLSKLY